MIEVRKTYPDLKMKIIRQYSDGDTVISEFTMEGTHLGEWLGTEDYRPEEYWKICWRQNVLYSPIDYDNAMNMVPYGKVITVGKTREFFAKRTEADFTDPITAGIFVSLDKQIERQ